MDGPSTYYAWYEYSTAGNPNRVVYSGAVNPDDDISVVVSWTASSNYPADFSFLDFNTGTHFNMDVAISSAYYDGSSAEFIDGRPSSSVPLANFGPITNGIVLTPITTTPLIHEPMLTLQCTIALTEILWPFLTTIVQSLTIS